jgi:hypothetical protein
MTIIRPTAFKLFYIRTYLISHLVKIGIPRFIVNLIPSQPIRELREIVDILHNTSVEILQSKKKALEEGDEAVSRQIGQGKDILSILSKYHLLFFVLDITYKANLILLSARKHGGIQRRCFKPRRIIGTDVVSFSFSLNVILKYTDKPNPTPRSLTFAAMDTTSSALSRILYLLSTNQEAQERLRQEIRTAKKEYGPDLDYDTLSSLPYLDAICRETLRL